MLPVEGEEESEKGVPPARQNRGARTLGQQAQPTVQKQEG